jgi:apolipoprotein N-acyltransferase
MKRETRAAGHSLILGVLFFLFSNGRWMTGVAAWMAPAFLLHFTRGGKAWSRLLLVLVLQFAASCIMLEGIVPSGIGPARWAFIGFSSLLWFLPYAVDRLMWGPNPGLASTLVFPAATVVLEYLPALPFGTWGSIAYSQYGHLPVMQLASVTGLWGISFLVAWFGSMIQWAVSRTEAGRSILVDTAPLTLTLGVVLIGGSLRLTFAQRPEATVQIGCFSPGQELTALRTELEQRGYRSYVQMARKEREQADEIGGRYLERLFERTEELAERGAQVVVWPEGAVSTLQAKESEVHRRAAEAAKKSGAYVLIAYSLIPDGWPEVRGENKAVMFDPEGTQRWEYLKAHPVPGAAEVPGDGILPMLETPHGRLSNAICYDMDFPNLIRQAGKARVELMLAPSWDWKGIDPLHTRMAVFRAIEGGFSFVRAVGEGLSIAVDPYGRVLGAMDHFEVSDPMMMAHLPIRSVPTVYAWAGDFFPWLSMLWLGGCVVVRFRRDKTDSE